MGGFLPKVIMLLRKVSVVAFLVCPLLAAGTERSTAADRATDVINIRDYGAKCDGKTDDAAAINDAFAAARTRISTYLGVKVVFPQANCAVASTLNWTMLRSKSLTIDGGGAVLVGKMTGTPVVDALGSWFMRLRDLTITTDGAAVPNVGLRIGRSDLTSHQEADNIYLDSVAISGNFSLAALHNLNAETSEFNRLVIVNSNPSPTSYGLIQDGLNHFDAQSAFVKMSQPVDVPQSFNENVCVNCDIRHNGAGVPIWMGQTTRHRFVSSYAAAVHGTIGIILYSVSSSDANSFDDLDLHVETGSVVNTFLLSGPNPSPSLPGFRFRDQYTAGSNALLKLDKTVTTATMSGVDLVIGGMPPGSKVFDAPAAWTMSGHVFLGNVGYAPNFNYDTSKMMGCVNKNGMMNCTSNSPNMIVGAPSHPSFTDYDSGRAMFGYDGSTGKGNAVVSAGAGNGFALSVGGVNGTVSSGELALKSDVNGLVSESFQGGIAAAGNSIATATHLLKNINIVTVAKSGQGVSLAAWAAAKGVAARQEVINSTSVPVLVYPPAPAVSIVGGPSAAANGSAVSLAAGDHSTFTCISATLCYQTH